MLFLIYAYVIIVKYQRVVLDPVKAGGTFIATADEKGMVVDDEQLSNIRSFNQDCCVDMPSMGVVTLDCSSTGASDIVYSVKLIDTAVRDCLLSLCLSHLLWHEEKFGRVEIFAKIGQKCLLGYSLEVDGDNGCLGGDDLMRQRIPIVGSVGNANKLLKRLPTKVSESTPASMLPYNLCWSYH